MDTTIEIGCRSTYEYRLVHEGSPYGCIDKQCTYCGSLHPLAVLRLLGHPGVTIELADMKHGWPHKFYLSRVPNPKAGQRCVVSSMSLSAAGRTMAWARARHPDYDWMLNTQTGRFEGRQYSWAPSTMQVKFYSTHLQDCDDVTFELLADALAARTGVRFTRPEGNRLVWTREL